MKFSIKDFSKDLVTFTEEIFNQKLHFFRSVSVLSKKPFI